MQLKRYSLMPSACVSGFTVLCRFAYTIPMSSEAGRFHAPRQRVGWRDG
jgi:hypothetical protein